MLSKKSRAGAAVALVLVAAACSDSKQPDNIAGPEVSAQVQQQVTYRQVEQLGNPLVQEVTIVKARHVEYDRTMPYNQAAFRPETEAFIRNVGGRPADYAATVAGLLYPDMIMVETRHPENTAGYQSIALRPGSWGGRKLADDVVDISLIAVFSSLLDPRGASCAPGNLPLCTDNVGANDKAFLAVFPYFAARH